MNETIYTSKEQGNPCFCVGRQGKEPMCPCRMKALKKDLENLKEFLNFYDAFLDQRELILEEKFKGSNSII